MQPVNVWVAVNEEEEEKKFRATLVAQVMHNFCLATKQPFYLFAHEARDDQVKAMFGSEDEGRLLLKKQEEFEAKSLEELIELSNGEWPKAIWDGVSCFSSFSDVADSSVHWKEEMAECLVALGVSESKEVVLPGLMRAGVKSWSELAVQARTVLTELGLTVQEGAQVLAISTILSHPLLASTLKATLMAREKQAVQEPVAVKYLDQGKAVKHLDIHQVTEWSYNQCLHVLQLGDTAIRNPTNVASHLTPKQTRQAVTEELARRLQGRVESPGPRGWVDKCCCFGLSIVAGVVDTLNRSTSAKTSKKRIEFSAISPTAPAVSGSMNIQALSLSSKVDPWYVIICALREVKES
jgi:hypothetical protein